MGELVVGSREGLAVGSLVGRYKVGLRTGKDN